ncbi:MAG: peptide deformylase [Bacteroidales bacterium]|nr:peptide deformylase [Clostridium sp.]MCM1202661.1 peptide deformylase [Bacteroidales bacterium]
MALRQIRLDGDSILRKKCKEVKEMKERTRILIEDMFETMYAANGVGLAAPQVGILKRIVVVDVDYENPYVLINPVIVLREGEQTGDEGCLSLPGKVGTVTRPSHVICRCLNENMEEVEIEGEGLLARAICHEVDHLEGVLYKDLAEGPIRDAEYEEPEEE